MASLYDHPRSDWTTTKTAAHKFDHTVQGSYLHYPGAPGSIQGETDGQIASRLRGYRKDHVNGRGWKDIAYNVAVDGRGHSWELRGIERESGANGGTASNNVGVAVLMLVGNSETPTDAMIAGVLRVLAQIKAMHRSASWIRGHQQSPDASTDCPGTKVMQMIRGGRFTYSGPSGGHGTSVSVTPAGKLAVDGRAGTATMVALQGALGVARDGRAAEDTWAALQRKLGTPVDGVVSHQSYQAGELGNGIVPRAWKCDGRDAAGSTMVRALQAHIGMEHPDGIWFEGTTRALQEALNAGRF